MEKEGFKREIAERKITERKIKAVIFDQDGLMFDTERVSAEAWGLAGDEFNFHLEESFLCTIRGANFQDTCRKAQEAFGDSVDFLGLRNRKQEIYMKLLAERGIPVKPGLKELLHYLKEHEYKIALATASTKERTMKNLKEVGIEDYFENIITGDMVEQAKPNPELFLKSAEVLQEAPEDCVVLEDSLNGVEAGIRGGFVTIMVPDITQPDEELRGRVSYVCASLHEVRALLESLEHNG